MKWRDGFFHTWQITMDPKTKCNVHKIKRCYLSSSKPTLAILFKGGMATLKAVWVSTAPLSCCITNGPTGSVSGTKKTFGETDFSCSQRLNKLFVFTPVFSNGLQTLRHTHCLLFQGNKVKVIMLNSCWRINVRLFSSCKNVDPWL